MSQPYRSAPDGEVLSLPVRTGELDRGALRFGATVWGAWSVAGALAALSASGLSLAAVGVTLAFTAVGSGPAALAAHWAAQRGHRRLRVEGSRVSAEGAALLDLDAPLDACVLELGDVQHLLATQGGRWLILSGQGLRGVLGGAPAWGERWHELRLVQLRHRELELGLEAFAPAWHPLRAVGARVVGGVTAGAEVAALAHRLRERAASSEATLVLPTAHPTHPVLVGTGGGVLRALGVELDARRALQRTPVWASRARQELDALVLAQGEAAVCLSLSQWPGAGPGVGGGFVPSTPELPGPELPPEEVVLPVVLAAVDGWLGRWERAER